MFSQTPETMRKNGGKAVGMDIIEEIKYVRNCSLDFIENENCDSNWFDNFE